MADWRAVSSPPLGAVPLTYRLPNPPRRAAPRPVEEETLRDLLGEGPLTVVHGEAGAGKSALVCSTMHRYFRDRVERTLVVSCQQRRLTHAGRAVLEAWASAQQGEGFDWQRLGQDEEKLEAAVIDAIEQSGWWVVLEDAGLDATTLSFIGKIERYARDARWVVVTRDEPDEWLLRVHVPRVAFTRGPSDALGRAPEPRVIEQAPPASTELSRMLALGDDPAAAIEALGVLRRAGRIDTMVEALDRGMARWLAAGFGPALSAALDGVVHPSVRPFRLRCALAVADTSVLRQCDAPGDADPAQRLDWGRVLQVAGDHAQAATVLASVVAASKGRTQLESATRIALARSLLAQRKKAEAREVLSAIGDALPVERALRDALLACTLAPGDTSARPLVDRALEQLPALSRQERVLVGVSAARALHHLGLARACRSCLEQAFALADEHPMTADVAIEARLLRAENGLATGDLAACDAALEVLSSMAPRPPGLRPPLLVIEAERALLRGDDRAAGAALSALEAEASAGVADLGRLRSDLHAMRGLAPPPLPPLGEGSADQLARLSHLRAAARHGDVELPARTVQGEAHGGQRALRLLLEAEVAAMQGDAQAPRLARAALDDARSSGLALRELEALSLLADVHLMARSDASPSLARELEALATRLGSPRHQAHASLLLALQAGPRGLADVERLAAAPGQAEASRRARALLGDDAPRDRLDAAVIAAMQAHLATPETLVRRPTGPRWGLHLPSQSVFRDDGVWIDLSSSAAHFKLLDALRALGGRGTKEQLVQTVWGERSYHPGRHDNRLHTAVRKLRRAIEEDPSTPRLVLTEEDGYALGGTVRVAR